MLDDQFAELDRLVKERYGVLVAEFDGYERDLRPDFREYHGVRLLTVGLLLAENGSLRPRPYGEADVRPSMDAAALGLGKVGEEATDEALASAADDIAFAFIFAMRNCLKREGSGAVLCFLESQQMPHVFPKVRPDVASLEERSQVRARHVFAVRGAPSQVFACQR